MGERIKGLRCDFVPVTSTTKICIRLTFAFGSNAETEYRGLAHMVEHMFFKSNGKPLEGAEKSLDKRFQDNTLATAEADTTELANYYGSSYNASTSNYATSFYHEVYHGAYRTFLVLLLNFFQGFTVSEEELDTEKRAVLEEKRLGLSNTTRQVLYRASELLFGVDESPHYTTIGTVRHLHEITADVLNEFISTNYRRANAHLVIMGNFDKAGMVEEVTELMNMLPEDARPPRAMSRPSLEPRPRELVVLDLDSPDEQFHYAYATRVDRETDPYSGRVLASLLINNADSPLRRRLMEHGSTQVMGFSEDFFEGTMFVLVGVFPRQPEGLTLRQFGDYVHQALSMPLSAEDIVLEHREIEFANMVGESMASATMEYAMQTLLYGGYLEVPANVVAPESLRTKLLRSTQGVLAMFRNDRKTSPPPVKTKRSEPHEVRAFLPGVLSLEKTHYDTSEFALSMYSTHDGTLWLIQRPQSLRFYQTKLYFPRLVARRNSLDHVVFALGVECTEEDPKFQAAVKKWKRRGVYGSATGLICHRADFKKAAGYTAVLLGVEKGAYLSDMEGAKRRYMDRQRAALRESVARALDEAKHALLGHPGKEDVIEWLSGQSEEALRSAFIALFDGVRTLSVITQPVASYAPIKPWLSASQPLVCAPSPETDTSKVLTLKQAYTTVLWARKGLHTRSDPKYHTYAKLLSVVAFHSLGSRLFRLRESVGMFYTAMGGFGAYAERDQVGMDYVLVETSKYGEDTESRVRELLSHAYWEGNPVTEHELVWARSLLLNAYLEAVAETSVLDSMAGGAHISPEYYAQLHAVTVADLQTYALKAFTRRFHFHILIQPGSRDPGPGRGTA